MFNAALAVAISALVLLGTRGEAAQLLAQLPLPGTEKVAETLQGKSIEYLLLVVTLTSIGTLGWLAREFIKYAIQSKDDQRKQDEAHAAQLKDLHDGAREDLKNSLNAINNLTDELARNRKP